MTVYVCQYIIHIKNYNDWDVYAL